MVTLVDQIVSRNGAFVVGPAGLPDPGDFEIEG